MVVDISTLPDRATLEADVCIIGGGAAGITLARELADSSTRVIVLEGGGLEPEPGGRRLYEVVPGSQRLRVHRSRAWYFGGATNHWGGNCRPLEDADFEAHDWIPHSGWPIRARDLAPYYERAQVMAGLGSARWYDVEACRAQVGHPLLDVDSSVFTTRVVHTCPTPSFAALHGEHLAAADNLRVVLRAEALRFRTNSTGDRVRAVEAVGPDRTSVAVVAGTFVLATGCVENTRLLLCSNDVRPQGLGNDRDLVGRFFMEHWCFDVPVGGWGQGRDLEFHSRLHRVGDAQVWGQLVLNEDLRRRARLAGLGVWFRLAPDVPLAVEAVRLLRRPATELALRFCNPGRGVAREPGPSGRRTAGDAHEITVQPEQLPDPENRLRLSAHRDRFGRPTVALALRFSGEERRNHARSLETVAAALGLDGSRLVRQLDLRLRGGSFGFINHHIGCTRMHADPAHGVVDAQCRVHGVSNLFVAGSSVFPTSGTAPPTLTIVALALRLADHLRAEPTAVSAP